MHVLPVQPAVHQVQAAPAPGPTGLGTPGPTGPPAEEAPVEEEEVEEEPETTFDEDGVEWWEDEDGAWWFRNPGEEEWQEYSDE